MKKPCNYDDIKEEEEEEEKQTDNNDIGKEGAQLLTELLKVNTTLVNLEMESIIILLFIIC